MKQKLQLLPSRIRLLLGIIGVFLVTGSAQAQLAAGDLAITSFNAIPTGTGDTFSFVCLTNITAGTVVNFTDYGYNGSSWLTGQAGDGIISWTAGSGLTTGTEVVMVNNASYIAGTGTSAGTVSGALTLSQIGDQIIAYQGTLTSSPTLIFAFHYNYHPGTTTDATWDGGGSGQPYSAKPPGVTPGFSSFWVGTYTDGVSLFTPSEGSFNCTGTPAASATAIRTAVCNSANWSKIAATTQSLPTPSGCTFLASTPTITTHPTPSTICANGSTTFTVAASGGGLSYQWQVSTNGGTNYNPISNGTNYANVTSATLNVNNAPAGFNNNLYRCVVSNGGGSVNSNGALLTVNSAPAVTGQPGDATICPNGTTSFTVGGSGGALSYQWQVNTGSGFSNVPASAPYSGTTSATLTLTNAPATMYGYQYRAVVSNSCGSSATSNAATLRFSTTWTAGAGNTNWNTASNWSCGVPTQDVDVVVNSGPAFMPTVNANSSTRSLTIGAGATVTVGNNFSLSIYGTLTNGGTFNANNTGSTVVFASTATQNVPGGNYRNLTISGGSDKNAGGNITLSGTLALTSGRLLLGANNITTSSAVSGYSSANYIVTNGTGALTINNIGPGGLTGAVFFPVGTAASYTPAAIANTGALDNFSVRTIAGVYASYTVGNVPIGAPISNNVVNSTWFVSETSPGGSDASLIVQWNAADELFGFVRSAVTLSHYTGGSWDPMTLTGAGGGNPYFVTRNNITTFSPFGVGNSNSALPVIWKSFTGRAEGQSVVLDWTVADEKNIVKYDVQRSEDGRDFSSIGSEKAKGGAGMNAYTFTDRQIAAPVYYYRIRMTETSGASSFSPVVRIATRAENKIRLLSNPVVQDIKLELNAVADGSVSVKVADLNGRKVLSQVIAVQPGTRIVSIPAAGLIDGQVYFLDVQGSLGNYTFKVLK